MRHRKHPRKFFSWLTSLSVALSLCGGIITADSASAQSSGRGHTRDRNPTGQSESWLSKVSPDLRDLALSGSQATVRVILQLRDVEDDQLNLTLGTHGKRRKHFRFINSSSVEINASWIPALAGYRGVRYVSSNQEIKSLGHVSLTTGADNARAASGGPAGGLDGSGIGVAVLDSGMDTNHTSFLGKSANTSRVVVSRDFTGEGRTDDPFGHGTHVASAAAGNGRISNAKYMGVAPNANIINLRVLNSSGKGTVSGLLEALEWVATNHKIYNIRVANMSIGMLAVQSYRNDPVCLAVRRLANLGIVPVAAAGNNGKNGAGQKLYGHIHSPGIEPSAITVGASNTFATDGRNDDGVAT